MTYKDFKFLLEILEFLVLFCLCHAFRRHTSSQYDQLVHLNFLDSSQCIHFLYIFHRHKWSPKTDAQLQCMTLHCHILMTQTQRRYLSPKKIQSPKWLWEVKKKKKKKKNPFICSLNRSSQLCSHLQTWKPSGTMKGLLSRFFTHANANISLPFHCPVQFSLSAVSNSLWPHGLQKARPLCPSPAPRVYSNSCPLSQ